MPNERVSMLLFQFSLAITLIECCKGKSKLLLLSAHILVKTVESNIILSQKSIQHRQDMVVNAEYYTERNNFENL